MKFLILLFTASLLVSCVHTPPNYTVQKDLLYSSVSEDLKGDLYLPDRTQKAPMVVLIHGGGWTGRTRSDMNDVAQKMVSQGLAVFNISYRLAPTYRFPEQVKDIRAALRFLKDREHDFNYDIQKVALYGYSAGGHLAALTGLSDIEKTRKDEVRIKAIVAGGAPADLTKYENSKHVVAFLGGPYSAMPEKYKSASPIFHVNRGDPPVFLFHGKNDWVVEYQQMLDFQRKLEEEGVGVETFSIPLIGHVATFLYSDSATEKSIVFLKEHLK